MSWVATAVAGAAVVGAVSSKKSNDKAIDAQQAAAKTSSDQLLAAQNEAKEDLFKLFPAANQNSMAGYQGALDVFKQTAPQQMDTFQQGNVAAQNQLLAGMPQFQNAILGAPVDYSQFQATQLEQPDLGYLDQQLNYLDPYAKTEMPEPQIGVMGPIAPDGSTYKPNRIDGMGWANINGLRSGPSTIDYSRLLRGER